MASPSQIRPLSKDLFIDLAHNCLLLRSEVVNVGRREFAVLRFLYEARPYFSSRQEILSAVWGTGTDAFEDSNVDHAIGRLREKLDALGVGGDIRIEAESPYGFRLLCPSSFMPKMANAFPEWKGGRTAADRAAAATPGRFSHAILTDTQLVAIGVNGGELWSHRFPHALRRFSRDELDWRVQEVNPGAGEAFRLLVAARFRPPGPPDTLYCFGPKGEVYWSLELLPPLIDRGGRVFEKAWTVRHVVLVSTSGTQDAWVALVNDAGWAGCVMRVNSEGGATLQFANGGYVERLGYVRAGRSGFVIACGETNAFENAFVALLGVNDPPSCSPLARSRREGFTRYRYANAPKGTPHRYIRFPNTELVAARGRPYGHTRALLQFPGRVIVDVETGEESFFRYHFAERLEPEFVFPSGNHEFAHRDLETIIGHSWENCPERAQPLILKIWERGTGWRDCEIPWRDDPWKEK